MQKQKRTLPHSNTSVLMNNQCVVFRWEFTSYKTLDIYSVYFIGPENANGKVVKKLVKE